MKLVQYGAGLAFMLAGSSQARLKSECDVNNLVITIPLQDEQMAHILKLSAGTCNDQNIPGGIEAAIEYESLFGQAKVTIPIEECGMKDVLYAEPLTQRSVNRFYRPTANLTLGHVHEGVELLFKHYHIAAECGMKTHYEVDFEYNVGADEEEEEECQMIDGVCVFPAWHEDARFEIVEFTDSSYTNTIDNGDLVRKPGEFIHLAIKAYDVPLGYEHAITHCKVVSATGTESELINPVEDGTCSLESIKLEAAYVQSDFRLSHLIFMLDSARQSTYTLKCYIELCKQGIEDSVCQKSSDACGGEGVCGGSLYDFEDSNGVADRFEFNNCGNSGNTGPSLANCRSNIMYSPEWCDDSDNYGNSNGIQIWTVPANGLYRIEAVGATGAQISDADEDRRESVGHPARITGSFVLQGGQKIKILVGQHGFKGTSSGGHGGGGGTFIADANNNPMVVAGGAGSSHSGYYPQDANGILFGDMLWQNANPVSEGPGYKGDYVSTAGYAAILMESQTIGAGGHTSDFGVSGAPGDGAGFAGDGYKCTTGDCTHPLRFIAGGNGDKNGGGFGGGAGGGNSHGGAAGGYSGGRGARERSPYTGGGAGSYNAGLNQVNELDSNDRYLQAHGRVIITKLSCYLSNSFQD